MIVSLFPYQESELLRHVEVTFSVETLTPAAEYDADSERTTRLQASNDGETSDKATTGTVDAEFDLL